MAKLEYDLDDFGQASWPIAIGTLVYLFDRAGKYTGKPCVLMQCWQQKLSLTCNDAKSHFPWRGRLWLDDGIEIEASETEIMVLGSTLDFLDPGKAERATLPLPAGQLVYVNQRTGSDNRALVRCSVLAQRLEKVDVVEVGVFDVRKPDSKGASPRASEAFYQSVWLVDIRVEAGSGVGKREQVSNCDLYVQRVEI